MPIVLEPLVAQTTLSDTNGNSEGSPVLSMKLYGEDFNKIQNVVIENADKFMNLGQGILDNLNDDEKMTEFGVELAGIYRDIIETAFGKGSYAKIVKWLCGNAHVDEYELVLHLAPVIAWITERINGVMNVETNAEDLQG